MNWWIQVGSGSVKERVSRSHSLKETQSRKQERNCDKDRKEAKEVKEAKDGQHSTAGSAAGASVSLKQKITNVLYPDREQHDPKESRSSRNITHPPPSLYSALDSCLYLAAQGM